MPPPCNGRAGLKGKWLKFTWDFDEPCYGRFLRSTWGEARNDWLFTRSSCTADYAPTKMPGRRNVLTSKPVYKTREEWTAMCSGEPVDPDQLLTEARQGKGESLGALLQFYRNYLYLLARTQIDLHLQARANPSDLVQETFLQACSHFHQFRGSTEKELLAWLRRILVHNLARLVEKQILAQKRNVRREVSLERYRTLLHNSSEHFEMALVSSCSSPSVQAQRRELAALVADQLARLPAPYRDVIVLRNLEGLAFDEVAKRMERTPGAVRVLWLRALDHLRQLSAGGELS